MLKRARLFQFLADQFLWLLKDCVFNVCVLSCTSDPPSADLDQLELPVLCDGLRRYLQDLPQPIIPTMLYAQMVHAAKGKGRGPRQRFTSDI